MLGVGLFLTMILIGLLYLFVKQSVKSLEFKTETLQKSVSILTEQNIKLSNNLSLGNNSSSMPPSFHSVESELKSQTMNDNNDLISVSSESDLDNESFNSFNKMEKTHSESELDSENESENESDSDDDSVSNIEINVEEPNQTELNNVELVVVDSERKEEEEVVKINNDGEEKIDFLVEEIKNENIENSSSNTKLLEVDIHEDLSKLSVKQLKEKVQQKGGPQLKTKKALIEYLEDNSN